MRKILAASALTAVMTLGIGGPAVAQTGGGADRAQTATENNDSDDSGKLGLLGLLGLAGLAGLARRDHGRDRGRGDHPGTTGR